MHRLLASCCTFSALCFAASTLHAAPIATLECGQNKVANLSSYSLESQAPVVNPNAASGPGKVQLLPLVVRAALSQFQPFYTSYFGEVVFPSCTLSSTAAGQTFKIELKMAQITSFSAAASNNNAAKGGEQAASAYIEFTLHYQSIDVEASGPNDGGTLAPPKGNPLQPPPPVPLS